MEDVLGAAHAEADCGLLHAHTPVPCGLLALEAGRKLRRPVMLALHGSDMLVYPKRGRTINHPGVNCF